MELGRSRAVQHPPQEVWNRFSYTECVLSEKDKKSAQGKVDLI